MGWECNARVYTFGIFFLCREICNFQSLRNKTAIIDCLLLLDKAQIPDDLEEHSVRLVRVSSLVMEKLSGVESAESIEAVALMRIPSTFYNVNNEADDRDCRRWFASPHRILVLDGIQVNFFSFFYSSNEIKVFTNSQFSYLHNGMLGKGATFL